MQGKVCAVCVTYLMLSLASGTGTELVTVKETWCLTTVNLTASLDLPLENTHQRYVPRSNGVKTFHRWLNWQANTGTLFAQ